MSVVTAADNVGPAHHALVLPACDCGLCGLTWARRRGRSRRFTEPVTLVMALEAEDAECRAEMVREHRECLSAMVCAADELIATSQVDDPRRSVVGLTVVMFAGELAAAVRPGEFGGELSEQLIGVCAQTVTAAMLAAAGCLVEMVGMLQTLAETVG
jgi:hypothetical protein